MSVPDKVLELVEIFNRNREAYLSGVYSEAQVRLEFIDPFFKALGWDMYNEKGYAEAYKDVIPEDSIKVGGATKAPDYCFRIGGTRKYFVEAKKPSVDLKDDISPAYQLRRYAWSGKLPLSILTDFEEFAVYDCRIKPVKTDTAATARTLYVPYTDYEKRWDYIASIFSRDEVLKGSFDKYAESTKRKRGTAEVDDVFLEEIESWRDLLARNIALRNPGLTTRELNYAVQRTIDRIIFLRICEDRGIEDYGKLMALQNGANVYRRLCDLFIKADERYNSGLFHFRHEKERPEAPDELTLGLTVDDKVLRELIKRLYYPDSPYEFSVLPANILGQVYEQFLGKVIRLTPKHRALVEDKPEVKKAGGVYYTPTYIVNYIVKNTVGELLEGKTPKQASKLRILDPACGSGSFLIGAYQYLLDWHRDWYTDNGPEKWAKGRNPRIYEGPGGDYRLATGERKRILLNNIYGVDIDSQAVEVTKLSLLLKVLEGENEQTLAKQLQLFHERALPDLSENIKCGNSLVETDFYDENETLFLDEEESYRINAFDWRAEFAEIITAGGFDVVIGNPPYLKEARNKAAFEPIRKSRTGKYCIGKMDLWYAFACVALDLVRKGGLHSFIGTNNWITNDGASILRNKIMSEAQLLRFVDFADFKVFRNASIQTMIYIIKKTPNKALYDVHYLKIPDTVEVNNVITALNQEHEEVSSSLSLAVVNPRAGGKPFTLVKKEIGNILEKIADKGDGAFSSDEIGNGIDLLQDFVTKKHLPNLKDIDVIPGEGIFVLSKKELESVGITPEDKSKLKPYYTPSQIHRYVADKRNSYWVIYANRDVRENIDEYPGIKKHLAKFAPVITSVYKPYGLHRPRDETLFTGEGIFSVRKARIPSFSLVNFPCYVSRAFMIIKPRSWNESNAYLLGVLNSQLVAFWLYHRGKKQGDQLQIDKNPLTNIPIRKLELTDPTDEARHDRIVKLVTNMQKLHKQLMDVTIPSEEISLQRQIKATDRRIDRLIYELYGLTEEEIKIVEEATE